MTTQASTLYKDPLVARVFREHQRLREERGEDPLALADTDENDAETEYEFYVGRLGYSIAQLLSWLEQLEHIADYLSDHSYSERLRAAGITRGHHLIYNIENFYVRLPSVFDRALQVVNNVFHLCLEESQCKRETVLRNYRVKRTRVPELMDILQKTSCEPPGVRNKLVHRESLRDPELLSLQLFYMQDKESWEKDRSGKTFGDFKQFRAQFVRELVRRRTKEFRGTTTKVVKAMEPLFAELLSEYGRKAAELRLMTVGSGT